MKFFLEYTIPPSRRKDPAYVGCRNNQDAVTDALPTPENKVIGLAGRSSSNRKVGPAAVFDRIIAPILHEIENGLPIEAAQKRWADQGFELEKDSIERLLGRVESHAIRFSKIRSGSLSRKLKRWIERQPD